MTGYTFRAMGTNASSVIGGNITPGLPAGLASGDLMVLHTGLNSTSVGRPSISGWTELTTHVNESCDAFYAKIAGGSETSPTYQWDASHQVFGRIAAFFGDVYTDIATIVHAAADRQNNTTLGVLVPSLTISQDNCLVFRGGHYVKTATNNGSTFADWTTNSGIFTKVGTDIMQNGSALGATWWYVQQTTAANYSADTSNITNADTNANSQGWCIALKSQAAVPPTAAIPSKLIFIMP